MNGRAAAARTAPGSLTGRAVSSSRTTTRTLTEGQRAYEAKRAAKAGVSLDKWLAMKDREKEAEARAQAKAAEPPKPKKDTLLSRLMERAQRPLK